MIVVCWEITRCMLTCDFVIVLESMTVQYSASSAYHKRVPHLTLGVTITRK
jgi:hypothetical protein